MAKVELASSGPGEGGAADAGRPFWFDLWRNRGWSTRVARNWQMDAAFRDRDRRFLDIVLPTLAPDQRAYVADVLNREGHAYA